MYKKLAIVLIGFYLSISSIQAEPLNYNIINFSADASEKVEQDLLVASLMVHASGPNRQKVSNQVTELSNNLLEKLRTDKRIEVKLERRNAYQYNNKTTTQWKDTVFVSVKSYDFVALNKMLAEVQKEAAISNLSYSISAKKMAKVKENLLDAAIKKFEKKGLLIAKSLGKNNFKIINMNFDDVEQGYNRSYVKAQSFPAATSAEVMNNEPGTTLVKTSITGSIQLQ